MTFFKLIRYPNLIMLVISLFLVQQTIIRFNCLTQPNLSDFYLTLYLISTVLLAAGGYIINDIYDQNADIINKPNKVFVGKGISLSNAWFYYAITSIVGIGLGLYVCYVLDSVFNAVLCIATFSLLYLYSYYFQRIAIIGNLIISLLIPSSMMALYVFEYGIENYNNGIIGFYQILPYLFFAFLTNLMREIIKDIEDINGDYNMGFKTLPILIGKKRTRNVVLVLNVTLLMAIIFVMKIILQNEYSNLLFAAVLVMVFIPSSILLYHLWSAKTKKEFHKVSQLLKIIMVLGILTMMFINF